MFPMPFVSSITCPHQYFIIFLVRAVIQLCPGLSPPYHQDDLRKTNYLFIPGKFFPFRSQARKGNKLNLERFEIPEIDDS